MKKERVYSKEEEKLNILTHRFGFIFSIFASVRLMQIGLGNNNNIQIYSYLIYGLSLSILYLASTLYHSSKDPERRRKLNIYDHSAIYLLIAGTYTPITLLTIQGTWGWIIFGIVWFIAVVGILMKMFFIGRFSMLSTISYVLMGWVIVIAIKPLINSMPLQGLLWLLGGGISYTIGALFYQRKSLKYGHAIFHVFVLLGSIFHYIVILNFTH
ncbi:MAG: hemolysin III family protein [Mariniphaga sp.]